jgi:hypothetical protein
MRNQLRLFLLFIAALVAQPFIAAAPQSVIAAPKSFAIPPAFARNTGQADSLARYVSVGGGQPIFFTTNNVRIVDPKRHRSIWLTFVDGAARDIDGEWSTGGRITVLRRASGSNDEPMYRDVVYRDVWRGIDARVSASEKGLKYSFEIAPGGDARAIHLRYSGADRIELTEAGEIVLDAGGSTIIDTKPVAYQQIDGRRVSVPVRFVQFESDVAFSVGRYDRTKPLVIDPTLVYSTYLGSSGYDVGGAIAVDSTGAAYVTGTTRYSDFPTTAGAFEPSFHGGSDAFAAKINASGTHFDYVTYLGGSGNEEGHGIAVDASGSAYVTGWTESSDFPTTPGAFRTTYPGNRDGFLTKLNSSGTSAVYSTYFGGNATTTATAVTVESGGYAYVVGQTLAENLSHSPGAGSRGMSTPADGLLMKFSPDGSQLLFSAIMGGNGVDTATAVAVDGHGHAVVTGSTLSTYGFSALARDTGHAPLQQFPAGPAYLSTDGGHTFASTGTWYTPLSVRAFAIDPSQTSTAYESQLPLGVMKTTDNGATWRQLQGPWQNGATAYDIAINPFNTAMLWVGTSSSGLMRSVDGGTTWVPTLGAASRARHSPIQASTVFAISSTAVYRSFDDGQSWQLTGAPANYLYYDLAMDPASSSTVYAATSAGVLKTITGGGSWTLTPMPSATSFHDVITVAVDPTSPNVVWAGMATGEVFKSTDAGATFTAVPDAQVGYPSRMVFDGGTLYISDLGDINTHGVSAGSFATTSDRGATWQHWKINGNTFPLRTIAAVNGVVYAGGDLHSDAFVVKLDTNGTTQPWIYTTYLGGGLDDYGVGIALDRNGNAVVAVETHSEDFPHSSITSGFRNTAVSRLNADGSALTVSTFVGPSSGIPKGMSMDGNDNAYVTGTQGTAPSHGVFVDQINPSGTDAASFALVGQQSNVAAPDSVPAGIASGPTAGDVFVAGTTNTVDFPTTANAPQPHYGSGVSDAFASKVSFGGPTPPPPPPPSPNLALFKPAFASSSFSNSYTPVNAVDGSLATRWSSQFTDNEWIYVDLQGTYNITEVKLRWEIAYGSAYQIDVSNDAKNWTTIATVAAGDGGIDDVTGLSGVGRYVRMNGIHRATQWGYSLYEFEVYGTAASPPPPPPPPSGDLALNRPVVSSSDYSSQYAAAFAVDGNSSTRWSSQFSDPQWIYVDLGQTFEVTRVKLVWETAYAADFKIQLSFDAKHWTDWSTAQGNTMLTNDMTGAGMGRYVRMYGTRRATQWGYSLWSFEVYGDPVNLPDVALHKDVAESSEFSPAYTGAFAVDGDSSTRWSSEFSDPQWITVDLGSLFIVHEVRLTWETAYGAEYQIQFSNDGVNWWTAATVTDGTGGVDDLEAGGTTRFVRMSGTKRGTPWGYSLWSFEVFAQPGTADGP